MLANDVTRGAGPAPANTSRLPLYVAVPPLAGPSGVPQHSNSSDSIVGGALVLCISFYYIMHSDSAAGSGQAERKQERRETGTSQELRDPRDTGVKTLAQKKANENS